MRRSGLGLILCALAIGLLSLPALSLASEPAGRYKVSDIRLHRGGGVSTRVEVVLNGIPQYKVRVLGEPDRLFLDLDSTALGSFDGKYLQVKENGIIRRIRAAQFSSATARIVLDLYAKSEYTVSAAQNPPRLLIELKAASTSKAELQVKQSLVAARMKQPVAADAHAKAEAVAKIAADAAAKAVAPSISESPKQPKQPLSVSAKAEIPSVPESPKAALAEAPAMPAHDTAPKLEAPLAAEPFKQPKAALAKADAPHIRSIVIDPGHGGHDSGALGPGGLMEKDVVLEIAKDLKASLEATGGYKVYLTRSTDVFLTLEERTAYANRRGADLFVSVHANADKAKRGHGVETYLLNWTDDEESMKVASRENRISIARMKKRRSAVDQILDSLATQNKRDESLMLAHLVQDSIIGSASRDYDGVLSLGVKQAFFYVLIGAKMPSILVETSFISNSMEAKRLASAKYRAAIADGISSGINSYFAGPVPARTTIARK